MAESQVPYPYAAGDLEAIRASLSQPRFATYLQKAAGDETFAIALYLYNARLSKAFLYPLSVVEITLRNAIDGQLVKVFGQDWPYSQDLRDRVLTDKGLITLDTAIGRARDKLGLNAFVDPSKDQVVATLTFDFWSNLLRPDYGDFWRTNLNIVFPHIARDESRHEVQQLARDINAFRNRVAHHEPVLDLNINATYAQMLRIVGLRCPITQGWLRYYATIDAIVRTRPRHDGAVSLSLSSRQDPNFVSISGTESIGEVLGQVSPKAPVILQLDAAGTPLAALTASDLAQALARRAAEQGGLVELETPVDELLDLPGLADTWVSLNDQTPLASAIKALQKPRIQILVGTDTLSGRATGTIQRAHRRY